MDSKGLNREYVEFWKKKEFRADKPSGLGAWWEARPPSRGYWAEVRRTRPESEAEAEHAEAKPKHRFGKYWAVDKPRRANGGAYTVRQSPYDPKPVWTGRTAPPRRIGKSAPKRWPAEAPGLRPHGLRPYEVKWTQGIASRVITDRMRLSEDPYNYQRLRDLKAHILERRRHSGSLFQNKEVPTSAQFARGVIWAELEAIELYRRHDQLRWFIDAAVDDEKLDFSSSALEHRSIGGETGIIAGVGRGIDSATADAAGFKFEELDSVIAERRLKYGRPLRERRKAGRKPLGDVAMTTAERVRKHRMNLKTPAPHGRAETGVVRPLPLGLAAPVDFLQPDEQMIRRNRR